ncbi:beta-galactosidase GalB [Armatimonas sp.]|uniref:beta-galactosidase GalB n=1 Tax=Armatimonas sp. TaxID=1872638 RepID=UPI00375019ED
MNRLSFDRGWKFARFGLMPEGGSRPEPEGMEKPGFDDGAWRALDLPHDWGIEGPFRGDLPNETGKLPWAGIGWYRKMLPQQAAGKRVYLDFDGAMSHPKVYVNGALAGEWAYGYASFRVDLTPHLAHTGTNLIAVRLDNPPDSSRWYPGGGLYRHVWLVTGDPEHVAHNGIFVHTPEATVERATVAIETELEGGEVLVHADVRHEILWKGKVVAKAEGRKASVTLVRPQLWSIEKPQLYTLRTSVWFSGRLSDTQLTTFGIRSIAWDGAKGFLLNGQRVTLNGVCNHHDLGLLGGAVHERAIERQLEILKEMGCNAIRTSHNPPAPELLDACDRMGFLVIDEAFDCWRRGKKPNDYHLDFDAWHERDIVSFVHRDRNHPCVIAWSSGNEIPEQGNAAGAALSRELTALFHREDPTRLVSAGCNNANAGSNGFSETVDMFGYNYKPHLYGAFRARYPRQPLFGSETSSCVSSYGEYFFPVEQDKSKGFYNFQVSSYDLYAPPWAMKPDIEWEGLDKNPSVAGEFVWTGFDYLGEPTPYNQDRSNALNFSDPKEREKAMALFEKLGNHSPSRSSYFGIVDLCGFKKDRFYLYQARWRPELPMAHLLPHWSWPGRDGQVTPVHLYTSGDEAELFLNGKSLGRKKRAPLTYRLVWDDVLYAPGELKAVAYKNGKHWAEAVQRTMGSAVALKLDMDRKSLTGGHDLSFITVKIVDAKGEQVPSADHLIHFTLTGSAATLAAVGNGDATNPRSFQTGEYPAFHGLALAIIRAKHDTKGEVILRAEAAGLKGAEVRVRVG